MQQKIKELRRVGTGQEINIGEEVVRLEKKCDELTRSIYARLTPQQIVQVARHPRRPHTLDMINRLFTDFDELHGDRHVGKAAAMVGGLARFNGEPVVVIGHEKGRDTKEKVERNFGMASPEGFRKALRLMKLAERFGFPVFAFLDTPGAYPGVTAEEHNQSEAIARNLLEMTSLNTPIICAVLGEGCSGGALGIGVGDVTLMLQYAYYSVISPEGCASILWKSREKTAEAAEALKLTAPELHELGLIDEIIKEPAGGAHRDWDAVAAALKPRLESHLQSLLSLSLKDLVDRRQERWLSYGA